MIILYRWETTVARQSNFKTQATKDVYVDFPTESILIFCYCCLSDGLSWAGYLEKRIPVMKYTVCLHSSCCPIVQGLVSENSPKTSTSSTVHQPTKFLTAQKSNHYWLCTTFRHHVINLEGLCSWKSPWSPLPESSRHPGSYIYPLSLFLAHEVTSTIMHSKFTGLLSVKWHWLLKTLASLFNSTSRVWCSDTGA